MIPSLLPILSFSPVSFSLSFSAFSLPRQFLFTPNRNLGITTCSTPISSMCVKEKEEGKRQIGLYVCVTFNFP